MRLCMHYIEEFKMKKAFSFIFTVILAILCLPMLPVGFSFLVGTSIGNEVAKNGMRPRGSSFILIMVASLIIALYSLVFWYGAYLVITPYL